MNQQANLRPGQLKSLAAVVIIGEAVAILMVLLAAGFLIANPEIMGLNTQDTIHMQLPVMLLALSELALLLLALIAGLAVIIQLVKNNTYSKTVVRALQLVALSFYAMTVPALALIIYTNLQIGGAITDIWAIIGIIAVLALGSVFWLIAIIINRAILIKAENDLTI